MLVFVVIFLIVSVQPAFFTSAATAKEKSLKYKKMKKETLNTYLNVFVLFAIAGSIMAFISGIDSIFDNPLGLIAVSIFLGCENPKYEAFRRRVGGKLLRRY